MLGPSKIGILNYWIKVSSFQHQIWFVISEILILNSISCTINFIDIMKIIKANVVGI